MILHMDSYHTRDAVLQSNIKRLQSASVDNTLPVLLDDNLSIISEDEKRINHSAVVVFGG